jgi:hypothetical protein
VQSRTLANLQLSAARQESYRLAVERHAIAAERQRRINAALDDISATATALYNPPPPPEPTAVLVEADQDDDTFCGVKVTRPNPRRSWW